MTGKQRAMLRSMANTMEPILYIGKDGVTDATLKETYDALEARELVKCVVQNNSELSAREACAILCEKTHAEPVQCIGRRFVLYRESRENKRIQLG
ncbi:MAG: ribosome assembly RNA-binding protein YhbY [Candidatus Limiplasma sp.]|nr:ribosome assembly RNA-binding protein YhbY [Candidatus Limiplasma sp.]